MLDALMHVLSRVLVPLFFIGMVGASVVVLITIYHDIVEFFEDDEIPQATAAVSTDARH